MTWCENNRNMKFPEVGKYFDKIQDRIFILYIFTKWNLGNFT